MPNDTKTCPCCQEEKEKIPENFGMARGRKDGLQVYCKACLLKKAEARKDEKRAYQLANREYLYAKHAEYREANKEKLKLARQAKRTERAAYEKIYRAKNREKKNEYERRRTARKNGLPNEKVDYLVLSKRDKVCYLCCLALEPSDELHRDHVVPLCKGGAHVWFNLATVHAQCNREKAMRMPTELEVERHFYQISLFTLVLP